MFRIFLLAFSGLVLLSAGFWPDSQSQGNRRVAYAQAPTRLEATALATLALRSETATFVATAVTTPPLPVARTLPAPTDTLCAAGRNSQQLLLTPSPSPTSTATVSPTSPVAPTGSPPPNGLPPLPKARTATPLPPKLVSLTLDELQAANLAAEQLENQPISVQDLKVTFLTECIVLRGQIERPNLIPGLPGSSEAVIVIANPQIKDERLVVIVRSIRLGESEVSSYHTLVESAINDFLARWLLGYRVQSFTLSEGRLTVQAFEPS